MNLDLEHFGELIDIRPRRGSVFIRSRSGPFEENDIDDVVLKNWLEHFGVEFFQVHASGHCSMDEVFGAVEEIGPDKVLPFHREHPEMFVERLSGERTLWVDDLPYELKAPRWNMPHTAWGLWYPIAR